MIIKSLDINQYRNYNNLSIQFDHNTNILYGDNAQGKTNILEAIYMCSTTKSHRGSKDKEIIQFNKDEGHIKLNVIKNNVENKIDIHLKKNKPKGIAINGIPIKRTNELFGLINVVIFSPEDLGIIKNGPSERRRFIDLELCQLDKIYFNNLLMYNKVLHQRNALLKQINGVSNDLIETLSIWDMQLLEYGRSIIQLRRKFINDLNNIIKDIHSKLTGGLESLNVGYEPNVLEEYFQEKLTSSRNRDIKLKTTHVGPHRDDISFCIKDIDIRKFGSQGQQRTAALSLKLSEIELVKKLINDKPILLLDDVLSELDSKRQNYLVDSIYDVQTIITCTGLEYFINNRINVNKIFQVFQGKVDQLFIN